jgi:hypothetical protein
MKPDSITYGTLQAGTLQAGNPHPSPENFKLWAESFAPELKGLGRKMVWILYTAAWCNGVTEEREHNEKINAQIQPENRSPESDA